MLDSHYLLMRFLLSAILLVLPLQGAQAEASKPAVRDSVNKSQPVNIVLITLDTTRADRMGFLGSKRGLTPNLDALSQQTVVFTRAFAQVPLTTPSHAAMLTGTYPQYNHVEDLGMPLGTSLPYVPSLLRQRGYRTAAFLGANVLDAKGGMAAGFDRGFDMYDTDFGEAQAGKDRYHTVERRAGDVVDRALTWLKKQPQKPFFVWLHFYDAHDPYDPPAPFKERYPAAPYDGEIAYVDSAVGTFVDALRKAGLYENSLIAIAADHGEAFGEHGEERHGMFLYDETIHVPLLLKLPLEKSAGTRVDQRVALVDIAPSLLQAGGVTPPATMQGQSLFRLLEEAKAASGTKEEDSDRPVFSSSTYASRTFGVSELRSWRAGKYLYVQAPKRELYNVPADPEASKNLASTSKAVADALDGKLSEFVAKTGSTASKDTKLDPVVVQKLRALGYLSSDPAPKKPEKANTDPKDLIDVANRYHRALVLGEEGHFDEEIEELRKIMAAQPDLLGVQYNLGSALVDAGRPTEAIPFLRAASSAWPESPTPHYQLGVAFTMAGQLHDALREMQAASVCLPSSAQLHYLIANLQTNLQQIPAATKEYQKALALDPNHFDANLSYGRILAMGGRVSAARPLLERAAKLKPQSAEVHLALADLYDQLGLEAKASSERDTFERLSTAGLQRN